MICAHCAAGADICDAPALPVAARVLAIDMHKECKGGTWCDCQHVVPLHDQLVKRREAAARGGLARIAGNA